MSFSPAGGANRAPPNSLAGFDGHFEAGKESGKERKGGERKGTHAPKQISG